jgi:hypothetical protein
MEGSANLGSSSFSLSEEVATKEDVHVRGSFPFESNLKMYSNRDVLGCSRATVPEIEREAIVERGFVACESPIMLETLLFVFKCRKTGKTSAVRDFNPCIMLTTKKSTSRDINSVSFFLIKI